jgi:hypothetical protein
MPQPPRRRPSTSSPTRRATATSCRWTRWSASTARWLTGGDIGTGTVYQTGRVLTAAHVVRGAKACTVDGQPAEVVWEDAGLDMAILKTDTAGYPVIPLSCAGVEPDKLYLAVGYAEGEDFSIDKLWWAGNWTSPSIEGQRMPHMAEMQGYLFQGQSGGPVLDLDGSQIGMVNASAQGAPMSLVRTLVDSPLCPKMTPAPAAAVFPGLKLPKLTLPSLLGPPAAGGVVILTPVAPN